MTGVGQKLFWRTGEMEIGFLLQIMCVKHLLISPLLAHV